MADDVPIPTTRYRKHRMGWLSPQGDYYPCDGIASHYGLACALLRKFHPRIYEKAITDFRAREDDVLQERGWIRIGAMMSYNYGFVIWKKPTQRQLDVIWDYCTATKVHMPSLEVI